MWFELMDWYQLQNMIKDIANAYGYMVEIAIAMTRNKCLDDDSKVYEYKRQILTIHYELNHKLLMYMGTLKRLGISYGSDTVYLDFYKTVVDLSEKIKRSVFDFVESKGMKDISITPDNDSELLNRVIHESDERIKELEAIQKDQ